MAKVIKRKISRSIKATTICPKCDGEVEFTKQDVKTFYQRNECEEIVYCPICGKGIYANKLNWQ